MGKYMSDVNKERERKKNNNKKLKTKISVFRKLFIFNHFVC